MNKKQDELSGIPLRSDKNETADRSREVPRRGIEDVGTDTTQYRDKDTQGNISFTKMPKLNQNSGQIITPNSITVYKAVTPNNFLTPYTPVESGKKVAITPKVPKKLTNDGQRKVSRTLNNSIGGNNWDVNVLGRR